VALGRTPYVLVGYSSNAAFVDGVDAVANLGIPCRLSLGIGSGFRAFDEELGQRKFLAGREIHRYFGHLF